MWVPDHVSGLVPGRPFSSVSLGDAPDDPSPGHAAGGRLWATVEQSPRLFLSQQHSSTSTDEVPRLGSVPALDGLRAVAVSLVVMFHYFFPWFRGGFLGVDIFFVLSGFLITMLLLQEHSMAQGVRLTQFYARRVRRLAPALAGVLAFAYVTSALSGAPGAAFTDLARVMEFRYNFYLRFHYPANPLVGHLWSLSTEEQFYLVWPPILVLLMRRRVGLLGVLAVIWTALVAVVLFRLSLWQEGSGYRRLYFAPDTHTDGLLIGAGLAVLAHCGYLQRIPARWVRAYASTAMVFLTVAIFSVDAEETWIYAGPLTVVALATAAMMTGVLTGSGPRWLESVLRRRTAVRIGKLSYSLYLWHIPILTCPLGRHLSGGHIAVLSQLLAVSGMVSLASYLLVEEPFRVGLRRSHLGRLLPSEGRRR